MTYPWDQFFREKIEKIFQEKKYIIDIGGGLRVSKKQGNRFDESRAWALPYLEKVDYKILDPVPDYSPDIIGDIHALPLADNSVDAIICIAVLEHVENPILAFQEMYRVLKPGGYCFIYVPFLFYYHAEKGYYHDYWRFTPDILSHLAQPFSLHEISSVRGALGTWFHLSPLGRLPGVPQLGYWLDTLFKKNTSKQVSGHNMFLVK